MKLANGSFLRVSAVDDLVWKNGHCLSSDLMAPVHFEATGERLKAQCCSFVALIKAEWWWYQRGDDTRNTSARSWFKPAS